MKKLLLMTLVLLGASQAGAAAIAIPQCSVGQYLVCNNLGQSCACVSSSKVFISACQKACMFENSYPCLCS